jgi:UrcA family protein
MNDLLDIQETTMNSLHISTNLSRLISTVIVGALALSWGTTSFAADDSDVAQAVVKFGDLNLSNPQGATALYHRLWSAAVTVCRPLDDGSLASRTRVQTCVHKAIADAVTKVDRAELFAVYNAKQHELRPIVVAQTR